MAMCPSLLLSFSGGKHHVYNSEGETGVNEFIVDFIGSTVSAGLGLQARCKLCAGWGSGKTFVLWSKVSDVWPHYIQNIFFQIILKQRPKDLTEQHQPRTVLVTYFSN